MWDHRKTHHQGDQDINPEQDFKFTVLESFKDPFTRQIREAVRIKQATNSNIFTDHRGSH